MKFVIFNGSPKGKGSITLQYFYYAKKKNPGHEHVIYNVGRNIKKIEKNEQQFNKIMESVKNADGIIWLFPVYLMHIPSQLKRFIELIFERKAESNFKGKYATTISTSEKFYDHTAHNYLHGMSEDLSLSYQKGLSARMFDLKNEEFQGTLANFMTNFLKICEEKRKLPRIYEPIEHDYSIYKPTNGLKDVPKTENNKVVIVTDVTEENHSLQNMIETFTKFLPNPVEIININDINMRGGCLGCTKCAYENKCFYPDNHNEEFKKMINAKILILAYSLHDRYFSAKVKEWQDRGFFNGHRPMFKDQQQGWLISGPLRKLPSLRQLLEARSEIGRANLAGIVTDEDDPDTVTEMLENLAKTIMWGVENNFTQPKTFLGEGGHKIFRDLIKSFRAVFPQDFKYFKQEKLFDFPKTKYKPLLLLSPFLKIKRFRQWFYGFGNKFLARSMEKIVENA